MAEVQQQPQGNSGSGRVRKARQRKKSTRIEMTAMVDVAFLLLTFFILTSTLARPAAMPLIMPAQDEEGHEKPVPCDKMMQIYLGEDDQVYWFPHCETEALEVTDFSGIRSDIQHMLSSTDDLIITIKAGDQSKFDNLVDILDEMKITGAPKYALVDMTPEDLEILSSKGLK